MFDVSNDNYTKCCHIIFIYLLIFININLGKKGKKTRNLPHWPTVATSEVQRHAAKLQEKKYSQWKRRFLSYLQLISTFFATQSFSGSGTKCFIFYFILLVTTMKRPREVTA